MSGRRVERVGESIRDTIGELLLREVKDPRLHMVTVTEVQMSKDLRHGRVFFSCVGDAAVRERALGGFASAAGFIRREVSRRLGLRYTPDLAFVFDPRLEAAEQMAGLMKEASTREE